MYIMTNRGWQPLHFPRCEPISPTRQPPRYTGPSPSLETLAFIAKCEQDHQDWLVRREELLNGTKE